MPVPCQDDFITRFGATQQFAQLSFGVGDGYPHGFSLLEALTATFANIRFAIARRCATFGNTDERRHYDTTAEKARLRFRVQGSGAGFDPSGAPKRIRLLKVQHLFGVQPLEILADFSYFRYVSLEAEHGPLFGEVRKRQ
jgi:hypothetical protein